MGAMRFYFHFRSPYSWLAVERLARDPIPFHGVPAAGVPAHLDPSAGVTPRLSYLVEDVTRIAERLGLPLQWPQVMDTEWVRPNAAFWMAQRQGAGAPFVTAAFQRRFRHGEDLGEGTVIAQAASDAGLDPEPIVAAMDDEAIHKDLNRAMVGFRDDGVCGVPFFVHGTDDGRQRFWGQDRLADLRASLGLPQVKSDF